MKKIIKTDDSSYFEADPRLHIFVGAYGSGKSEVSVHFARMLAEKHKDRQIILADLDIVNPFYRSADAISSLTEDNIRVIAPVYANTNVDVPALPPEINAIFDDGSVIGVLDLGGEDLGAKVLAGMRGKIEKTDFRVYMVINTFGRLLWMSMESPIRQVCYLKHRDFRSAVLSITQIYCLKRQEKNCDCLIRY